jgi:hypothetical protein
MDAFIRKYDPAGNVIWTLQLGTAATDEGLGVAVGSSGLYITGSTQGVLGPSGAGGQDAYVAKVAQISIVAIDIEPGSFPNAIDLDSQDVVPVAILSGPTFDATTVDPATVTLVCPAVEMESKSAGAASVEDVNGDSLPDIVVPVRTEALELSATDEDAQLDARTFDGRPIRGTDLVRVVAP